MIKYQVPSGTNITEDLLNLRAGAHSRAVVTITVPVFSEAVDSYSHRHTDQTLYIEPLLICNISNMFVNLQRRYISPTD